LSSYSKTDDLTETILKVMNEKKPQSVKQLMSMLRESVDLDEKVILESVLKLESDGVIKFENQDLRSLSLVAYLKTSEAVWYWVIIAAGAITVALVFTISANVYPWVYVRNFFGVIFVLFLPGYAFIKALFPVNILSKTSTGSLETIVRIALSIAMSIVLASMVGLLLYYSPWGLDLTAIVLSLLAITLVSATAAVAREYNIKGKT
jgi:uncharacterized membrane protein